jgi:hypothetical protein
VAAGVSVAVMLSVVGVAMYSGSSLTGTSSSAANLKQALKDDSSVLSLTASDEYGDTTATKFSYPFLGEL